MVECSKCGGKMQEGEVFVQAAISGVQASSGFGMMGIPGMGIPSGEMGMEEKIQWREKTGRKTGLLIKSDEEKTMKISGQRCIKCGYIELYARE